MHSYEPMDHLKLISETCMLQHVRAAARRLTEHYETILQPTGLTASQFTTLVATARAKGAPISFLAERLDMDRTTMTRVIAPLERRGLVATLPDKDDKRLRRLMLTDEGRALLTEAEALWDRAQDKMLEKITPDDWADMRGQLAKLTP
ncbi:MAG: MarR family transcriptional regulator [Pseudomonadota bacterium]